MDSRSHRRLDRTQGNSNVPASRTEAAELARQLLEQDPYFHGHAREITIEFKAGVLLLSGQLPSFYLKQMLQECLRKLDGVTAIDNRVDVVCCDGLSSGPNEPNKRPDSHLQDGR